MRPCESIKGEPSRKRINARNWYNSPLASTANRFPRRSSSASVCLMMIGVRRTPIHTCRAEDQLASASGLTDIRFVGSEHDAGTGYRHRVVRRVIKGDLELFHELQCLLIKRNA